MTQPSGCTQQNPAPAGFFHGRPARVRSCGCKSRRESITANEAKRNCMGGDRVWEGSVERSCLSVDKNRIERVAEQGEWA